MVKNHLIIICSITTILFSSCGGEKSNNATDKKIFRYNEFAGITSLDPAFGNRNKENTWKMKKQHTHTTTTNCGPGPGPGPRGGVRMFVFSAFS